VLVTGTGTGIGKTWWTAQIARQLRTRGVEVTTRKPVQSFDPSDETTDADVLAAATGDDPTRVCPRHRWLPVPMAPPMAAEVLGHQSFTISELMSELTWPGGCAVGLVETAGGPRSPLASDGDSVDLAAALAPDDVLLVADAGLGTINAVRLAASVLNDPVVALNRFDEHDDLHHRNYEWLAAGYNVVVDPVVLVDRLTAGALS